MGGHSVRHARILSLAVLFSIATSPALAGGFLLTPTESGYEFEDLGQFTPRDINVHGTVVGEGLGAAFGSDRRRVAVRWTAATGAEILPGIEDDSSVLPRGINDAGVIVGQGIRADDGPARPLIWRDGEVSELDTPFDEGVSPYDINNGGAIAASFAWGGGAGSSRYFSTFLQLNDEHNTVRIVDDLGDPPGSELRALARGINAHGDVIGVSNSGSFIWTDGEGSTLLPPLPGVDTSLGAADVNDEGLVAGASFDRHTDTAILWSEELGTRALSPDFRGDSQAYGLNNQGDVVGNARAIRPGSLSFAVLWRDGEMIDLNDLVSIADSRISLHSAFDINEVGQIIGFYSVIPEPSTGLLLGLGLVLMPGRRNSSRSNPRAALGVRRDVSARRPA